MTIRKKINDNSKDVEIVFRLYIPVKGNSRIKKAESLFRRINKGRMGDFIDAAQKLSEDIFTLD